MKMNLIRPCDNCPFRKDRPFYLGLEKATEIVESFTKEDAPFPCHKTTKFDEFGDRIIGEHEQHCAGALIILEKIERPNQWMRIMERLGMYDRTKLDMNSPVYVNLKEFLEKIEELNDEISSNS